MFDIRFLNTGGPRAALDSTLARSGQSEPQTCLGQITLGSFAERFESPLGFWREEDYERHWRAAVSRIVAGAEKTALLTAMYDPALANFLTWWPMYREQEFVFVQNHLLFMAQLTTRFDIEAIDGFVPTRKTIDDDGEKISEWSVPLAEIAHFLGRLNDR